MKWATYSPALVGGGRLFVVSAPLRFAPPGSERNFTRSRGNVSSMVCSSGSSAHLPQQTSGSWARLVAWRGRHNKRNMGAAYVILLKVRNGVDMLAQHRVWHQPAFCSLSSCAGALCRWRRLSAASLCSACLVKNRVSRFAQRAASSLAVAGTRCERRVSFS